MSNDTVPVADALSLQGPRSRRRRRTLRALSEQEPPIATETLAETVASEDPESGGEQVPKEAVDRVAVRLHHLCLPRLAEEGLLMYDSKRNLVTAVKAELLAALVSAGP